MIKRLVHVLFLLLLFFIPALISAQVDRTARADTVRSGLGCKKRVIIILFNIAFLFFRMFRKGDESCTANKIS